MSVKFDKTGRPQLHSLQSQTSKRIYSPLLSPLNTESNYQPVATLLDFTPAQLIKAFGDQPFQLEQLQAGEKQKNSKRRKKKHKKNVASSQVIHNRFSALPEPKGTRESGSSQRFVWEPKYAYLQPAPGSKQTSSKNPKRKREEQGVSSPTPESPSASTVVYERTSENPAGISFESILQKKALECIIVREGYVSLLQDRYRSFQNRKKSKVLDNETLDLLQKIRHSTVDAVETIQKWQSLYVHPREFVHHDTGQEPVNYLLKVVSSIDFLKECGPFQLWARGRRNDTCHEKGSVPPTNDSHHQLTANPLMLPKELYERVKYLPSSSYKDLVAVPRNDSKSRVKTPTVLDETSQSGEGAVWSSQALTLSAEGFVREATPTRVKECIRKLCEEEYIFGRIEDKLKQCFWCGRIPPNRTLGGQAFATCMDCKSKLCDKCVNGNITSGSESFDTLRKSTKWRCPPCNLVIELQVKAREDKKHRMRLANEKRKTDLLLWKQKRKEEKEEEEKQRKEKLLKVKEKPSGAARVAAQQLRRRRIRHRKNRNEAKRMLKRFARNSWIHLEKRQVAHEYLCNIAIEATKLHTLRNEALSFLQCIAKDAAKAHNKLLCQHRNGANSIDLYELDASDINLGDASERRKTKLSWTTVTRTADGERVLVKVCLNPSFPTGDSDAVVSLMHVKSGASQVFHLPITRLVEHCSDSEEYYPQLLSTIRSTFAWNIPAIARSEVKVEGHQPSVRWSERGTLKLFKNAVEKVLTHNISWNLQAILRSVPEKIQKNAESMEKGFKRLKFCCRSRSSFSRQDGHVLQLDSLIHAEASLFGKSHVHVNSFVRAQDCFLQNALLVPIQNFPDLIQGDAFSSGLSAFQQRKIRDVLKKSLAVLSSRTKGVAKPSLTWTEVLLDVEDIAIPVLNEMGETVQVVGTEVCKRIQLRWYLDFPDDVTNPLNYNFSVSISSPTSQGEVGYFFHWDDVKSALPAPPSECSSTDFENFVRNHVWRVQKKGQESTSLRVDPHVSFSAVCDAALGVTATAIGTAVATSTKRRIELDAQERKVAVGRRKGLARAYLKGKVQRYRSHILRQEKSREALRSIAQHARQCRLDRAQALVELRAFAEFARKVQMGDKEAVKRHEVETHKNKLQHMEEELNSLAHKDRLQAVHQQGTAMMVTKVQ